MGVFDVLSKVTGGDGEADAASDADDATADADSGGPATMEPADFRERANELAGRSDVPELDFSEASLPALDDMASGNHPVNDPVTYGSYLGETLVAAFDGEWVREDGWAVSVYLGDDDTTVSVFDAAEMAIERGPVFQQVVDRLYDQGDPHATGRTAASQSATEDDAETAAETEPIEEADEDEAGDAEEDTTDGGATASSSTTEAEAAAAGEESTAAETADVDASTNGTSGDSTDDSSAADDVSTTETTPSIDAADEPASDDGAAEDEPPAGDEDEDAAEPAAASVDSVGADATETAEDDPSSTDPGPEEESTATVTEDSEPADAATAAAESTSATDDDEPADPYTVDADSDGSAEGSDDMQVEPSSPVEDDENPTADTDTDADEATTADASMETADDPTAEDTDEPEAPADAEEAVEASTTTPADTVDEPVGEADTPDETEEVDAIEDASDEEGDAGDTAEESVIDARTSEIGVGEEPDDSAVEAADESAAEDADAGEDADKDDGATDEESEPASIPSRSAFEGAAIEFTNTWEDLAFDYSPESLALLDDFLDDQWAGRFREGSFANSTADPAEDEGPMARVGAYVGEVLVREYDGEWVPGEDGEPAVAVAGHHGRREEFPVFAVVRRSLIEPARIAYEVDAMANRLDMDQRASGAERTAFALGEGDPGTAASSADVITTILDRAEAFVDDWPEYSLNYRPASLVRLDNLGRQEFDTEAFREAQLGDHTDADALWLADSAAGASAYFAAVLVRHLGAQWEIGDEVVLSVEGPAGETTVRPFEGGVECLRQRDKYMQWYDRVHDAVEREAREPED